VTDEDVPDDEKKKRDLRFTSRVDQGISVDRDMSGKGHLARGSHTNMSNLRFNVQAKSRDYLDPELAALHVEPPVPKHVRAEREQAAADTAAANPETPPVRTDPPVALPSMASRIASAFKRFVTGR
jgi:hypothetical protein